MEFGLHGEGGPVGMLANRLARSFRHWSRWARRQDLECFRVYHDDIPEYPLIVECYAGFAVVQASPRRRDATPEARAAHQREVLEEVALGLGLEERRVILKERGRRPGGTAPAPPRPDRWLTVREQGLRFEVNLTAYHDTGLFLDHRLTRARVRALAADLEVANLFCYTGSFSVYAGAGGARHVTSVDLSNTYLDWTQRNLRLNSLDPGRHELVRADILTWDPARMFDLIVCDPPTFSNSKSMAATFEVDRDQLRLLERIWPALKPGGLLLFSTNDQRFRPQFEGVEITAQTVPEDFKGRKPHRCWELRKAGR